MLFMFWKGVDYATLVEVEDWSCYGGWKAVQSSDRGIVGQKHCVLTTQHGNLDIEVRKQAQLDR